MPDALSWLARAATDAVDLRTWRRTALEVLREVVAFDGALFHEMSPRAPFANAVAVGVDLARIDATRTRWDDLAVELAPLRGAAAEHGGVAIDADAFRGAARARYRRLVERPLGARSLMGLHLEVQGAIIAVIFLLRRADPGFSARERDRVKPLVPVLALGDAFHRRPVPLTGLRDEVVCRDQRLTARQREIVEHVALGHTNEAIGAALGISPHTVRNLLAKVRRRLGAANRAEVVRLAVLR